MFARRAFSVSAFSLPQRSGGQSNMAGTALAPCFAIDGVSWCCRSIGRSFGRQPAIKSIDELQPEGGEAPSLAAERSRLASSRRPTQSGAAPGAGPVDESAIVPLAFASKAPRKAQGKKKAAKEGGAKVGKKVKSKGASAAAATDTLQETPDSPEQDAGPLVSLEALDWACCGAVAERYSCKKQGASTPMCHAYRALTTNIRSITNVLVSLEVQTDVRLPTPWQRAALPVG